MYALSAGSPNCGRLRTIRRRHEGPARVRAGPKPAKLPRHPRDEAHAMEMKTLLVTGAAGSLGSELSLAAAARAFHRASALA